MHARTLRRIDPGGAGKSEKRSQNFMGKGETIDEESLYERREVTECNPDDREKDVEKSGKKGKL